MGLGTESLDTENLEMVQTQEAAADWKLTYVVIPGQGGLTTRTIAVFEDGSYTEWMPADALD